MTDGATSGRGTVVVLLNRMKGWVCYDGWDKSGADVLCRSLGYRFVYMHGWISLVQMFTVSLYGIGLYTW